jgi:phosphate transport system protein
MENSHIVARFDKDLNRIRAQILEMGDLVLAQIGAATAALDRFDATEVARLIATDRRINGMHKNVHTSAERLIALRQPVALDLRQALSPIAIAAELERIGDHAKTCAKRARELAGGANDPEAMRIIRDMSGRAQTMLGDALAAYRDSDIELAADIRSRDKDVDRLNKILFDVVLKSIARTPDKAAPLIHLILLSRNFERVGDHVVNMARHVHQIVTGQDLKASEQANDT